tara:strand:- start:383 stop:817 length:435 start_codon:yes stop_codon:yes gene_type:complete
MTEYRQDQLSKDYSKNKDYIKKRGIKKIANDVAKLLRKNNYVPTIKTGNSYYIDVFSPWDKEFDIKYKHYTSKQLSSERGTDFVAQIRISDHISPSGGGYNASSGSGFGNPDIYIDPQNGIDIKKVIFKVKNIAKENGTIPFEQ